MSMRSEHRRGVLKTPGITSKIEEQTASYQVSSPMPPWQQCVKRFFDVVVSIVGIPLLVPVFVITSVAIKFESKGPIFFRQTRVGKDGRLFRIFKFRSMYQDADKIRTSLESLNEVQGPVFKIRKDPRITKVGSFLRRTSIDEMPQLLNVIKGDMSLVGPRPPLPTEVARYDAYQYSRLAAKPGLTCLWQVKGRSNLAFEEWVELDIEYIRNQSLWLDVKILILTIPAVLKGSGAW